MLDAAGCDIVIIETVGVGQDEVDVVQAAHTVAVVSVPGMGDDIQAIKAGLLEIADLHVVNKADRPEADRTVSELRNMLQPAARRRRRLGSADPARPSPTTAPASPSSPTRFDDHLAWLTESRRAGAPRAPRRRRPRRRRRAGPAAGGARARPSSGDAFERAVDDVQHRRTDPRTAGRNLIRVAAEGVPS